jgi:hypothetical protein
MMGRPSATNKCDDEGGDKELSGDCRGDLGTGVGNQIRYNRSVMS